VNADPTVKVDIFFAYSKGLTRTSFAKSGEFAKVRETIKAD
jgi:hypothetical protein